MFRKALAATDLSPASDRVVEPKFPQRFHFRPEAKIIRIVCPISRKSPPVLRVRT